MKFGKALLEAETQCQALIRNGTTPCELMWVDYKFLKKHIRPIIENIADRKEGSNMSIRITLNSNILSRRFRTRTNLLYSLKTIS